MELERQYVTIYCAVKKIPNEKAKVLKVTKEVKQITKYLLGIDEEELYPEVIQENTLNKKVFREKLLEYASKNMG